MTQTRAEIVAVGTELLMGEITDTDSAYLASQLPLLGIELIKTTVVGDDRLRLCPVLRQALEEAHLVITTGGLGPTQDDLTRECVAEVLGEELFVDAELEKRLRAFFARLHRDMPVSNVQQARLIPSAQSIPNEQGTAPGWWVEKDGKVIITLPGPPRELQPMWQKVVKPRLQARFPGQAILTRTIKTYGLGEAKVGEMAAPLFDSDNPTLGIYAKPDGIHLRLIARGENANELLQTAEKELERIFGSYIWGKDEDSLQAVVGKWLMPRGLTLATMEDGTRGLLASMIASAEGSPDYYRGGLLAGSDAAKVACGLSPELIKQRGAISSEVAQAMAVIARERFSADFGLSTTGITGFDSPGQDTPGVVYIGFADSQGAVSWQQSNLPYRNEVRNRAAVAAIFRLRQRLVELKIVAP